MGKFQSQRKKRADRKRCKKCGSLIHDVKRHECTPLPAYPSPARRAAIDDEALHARSSGDISPTGASYLAGAVESQASGALSEPYEGAGGTFAGGGASASWADDAAPQQTEAEPSTSPVDDSPAPGSEYDSSTTDYSSSSSDSSSSFDTPSSSSGDGS